MSTSKVTSVESEEVAIKVSNISKSFRLPHEKQNSIKSLFVSMFHGKRTYEKQQVLKDVSFEIKKGEFFGIVGRNGSGKSTLLKLLSGIYTQDKGDIQVNGKLTPFIELGVGFNPDLTGRENVFLNGALLGFNRKEMAAMYEEIVEFAELERFMDQKLKNYSSGMQVRLAFSIAIRAQSDILVLDEVLAVGDEAFQKKCMDVFKEYKQQKRTVILVTHSMESVRLLCTRALMLSEGEIKVVGSVDKVANSYLRSNEQLIETKQDKKDFAQSRIKVEGAKKYYEQKDTMELTISWPKIESVGKVGVAVHGSSGEYIFGSNTGKMPLKGKSIRHTLELNLGPGTYYLAAAVFDEEGRPIEYVDKISKFLIRDDYKTEVGGLVRFDYDYKSNK